MVEAAELAVRINAQLDALGVHRDGADVSVDTGLSYTPSDPVRVRMRHRDCRYDIDDNGAAVGLAGKPSGWLDMVEVLVAVEGLNVNRRGVVSVPAVEGRDLGMLASKIARCSHSVYHALLEMADDF